jgi:hypothetical protein
MSFDVADLARLPADGTLVDVLTHELGHGLGFGTTRKHKALISGETSYNPTFAGDAAMAEYQALRGGGRPRRVPVEDTGGPDTRGGHWREALPPRELMACASWPPAERAPLSWLTAASLADLGYQVNLDGAEPYTLPDLPSADDAEVPAAARPVQVAPNPAGTVLPVIPILLPDDALDVEGGVLRHART